MKRFRGMLFVLMILLAAAIQAHAESVGGVVKHGGNPLPHCRISFGGISLQADASGIFLLRLDPGSYPVSVREYRVDHIEGAVMRKGRMVVFPGKTLRITIFVSK
jgi:hypothetical protein